MILYLFVFFYAAQGITRSTMYCREAVDQAVPEEFRILNDCWSDGVEAAREASPCIPTSGSSLCRCTQNDPEECDLLNEWATSNEQATAYCEERVIFVPKQIVNGVEVDDPSKTFAVCRK